MKSNSGNITLNNATSCTVCVLQNTVCEHLHTGRSMRRLPLGRYNSVANTLCDSSHFTCVITMFFGLYVYYTATQQKTVSVCGSRNRQYRQESEILAAVFG
jgi:hypothetical protein